MPPPSAAEIEGFANGALAAEGLQGESIADLAKAWGDCIAQSLQMFHGMAMVLPGIPAAAPPPSLSGSTTGPGSLMPAPAGAPAAAQLEGIANGALAAAGVRGEEAGALAKVTAGATAEACSLFTANVQAAPGIAIAGLVTAAPGVLI